MKSGYSEEIIIDKSAVMVNFSCVFHSVHYKAKPSYLNIIVGVVATGGLYVVNPMLAFPGVIGTAFLARVTIPSEIKHALDLHMVKMLIESGHVVEEGAKYVLRNTPQIAFEKTNSCFPLLKILFRRFSMNN
jgi:hypothetical protein